VALLHWVGRWGTVPHVPGNMLLHM